MSLRIYTKINAHRVRLKHAPPPLPYTSPALDPFTMAATDPIYAVWHRVRSPFRMPKGCHVCCMDDWEVFDVDKAGCVHCGNFHQCVDGGNCMGTMEHDHQACEITGCWIRNRNFQQGYTDTAIPHKGTGNSDYQHFHITNHCNTNTPTPPPRQWIDSTHVTRWLHMLVFSDTSRQCITREIQRVGDKAVVAFARVAKGFKLDGRQPCILEMLSHTRYVLGSLRIPCKIASQQAFDDLVHECSVAILRFTSCFRKVLMPHVPSAKLDHFVIGLIYLLRSGIVMFDTIQVVPRVPVLRRLLPMETSLKMHFRIPCKIITEVENIIKITLKSFDRRGIKQLMTGMGTGV